MLEARHPDHASGRAMLDDAAQLSHTLTIQLGVGASEPGAPIRRRVVDAQGVGLDSIEVRAEPAPGIGSLTRAPTCMTAADGSFELAPLDAHDYVLVATVPEHPPLTSEVVSPGAEVELRVPDDGLRLRGRLLDEQGEAVAAGTVALLAVDGLRRDRIAALSVFDVRGEFMFEGLGAGAYELQAIAQGYARSQPQRVTLPGTDERVVEVTLRSGASVFGRVVDANSHEPLPLAHVLVQGLASPTNGTVRSRSR